MSKKVSVTVITLALAMGGCSNSINSGLRPTAGPTPLPASPSGAVQVNNIPPATQPPIMETPNQNETQGNSASSSNQQMASANPKPVSNKPITRNAMAGAWNVPTDGGGCRILLAFTKWKGGYRAATKGCRSPEVQSITAWDVRGPQVVLVDGGGNTVARLRNSGGGRYDGTTSGGGSITFQR